MTTDDTDVSKSWTLGFDFLGRGKRILDLENTLEMNFSSREIPHISSTFKSALLSWLMIVPNFQWDLWSIVSWRDRQKRSINVWCVWNHFEKRSSHLQNSEYRVEVPTSCKKKMVTSCAIAHHEARIITVDFFPAFNLRPNDILVGGFNPFEKY